MCRRDRDIRYRDGNLMSQRTQLKPRPKIETITSQAVSCQNIACCVSSPFPGENMQTMVGNNPNTVVLAICQSRRVMG